MTTLALLQEDFQAFMLRGAPDIESQVVGTARVPVATRLAIYGEGYGSRLIEVLESNYPALARLLGPEDFAALGLAYVRAHDSHFRSVRYYGNELADFLAAEPQYAEVPVLSELARWEWAMTEAFDAADAVPIDPGAFASVPPEHWSGLRFELHPSVRQLALYWNVPQIWKALTGGGEERVPPAVERQPTVWMLWRQDLQTYFRSLQAAEATALDIVRGGGSFGGICAALVAHFGEEETPLRAAGYLRGWTEAGLISSLR